MIFLRKIHYILLLLFAFSSVQAASLYKWVDEEGNIHYSQQPPTSTQAEKLHYKSSSPSYPSPDRNAALPLPGNQDEEKKDAGKTAGNAADAEDRAAKESKNCEIARNNFKNYQRYRKVRQPDGQVVIMEDEQRQAKLKEAQEMIDKYCK